MAKKRGDLAKKRGGSGQNVHLCPKIGDLWQKCEKRWPKKIKTSNTQPCSKGNYTKAEVVILKCNNYARSVVDALPQNATQQQEDEAARKAKCDCLNLAVFGRPASISSSVGFEAGIMKKEVVDFFESGCSYAWISNVCSELRKVRDAILAISPVCKLPI